jgi:hypothetical protein
MAPPPPPQPTFGDPARASVLRRAPGPDNPAPLPSRYRQT